MKEFCLELVDLVENVSAVLIRIPDEDAAHRHAEGEWSKKEIVGHLVDSAANNHQRFVRAQQDKELVFPGYAQETWVQLQQYNSCSWNNLVGLWRFYNLHLADTVACIAEDQLSTSCTIGDGEPVSLSFLIEDYLAHLKIHIRQLGLADPTR